ncbi:unnamed protein product [Diatraea saccharalis]|uniref:Uncharacterized protein n=1 Tax=Diatraea saccharalis TaxID=40085 RepID=A0A9N9WM64_9NEOP|nr:unnamed protein product [Diatraea saccharalis]
MENSTYPGTDTEYSNTCELQSNTSQGLNLVENWLNLTIEDEISRGSKLRNEKSRNCPPRTECRLVDINNSKTVYDRNLNYRAKSNSRCWTQQSSYGYNPQAFSCSPTRTLSNKSKSAARCSLRIAELAVPTKRQCIETWRTKCDILPPFMVERLKQQVMDEKPLIHITDAVNCFKRTKSKSTKSSKRQRTFVRDNKINNERMLELRKLCAIFGKKIAQKLITPQNIKLNPELDKISKIVADELANIMKSGKVYNDNVGNKMQAEISEKIAVWVGTILEDTTYKLLEEDLRDLEEEEGPVLDFIDDVIDNVMKICNPQLEGIVLDNYSENKSHASSEDRDMNIASPLALENNEYNTPFLHENILNETKDNITDNKGNSNNVTTGQIQNEFNKNSDTIITDDSNKDEPNIQLVNKSGISDVVDKETISDTDENEEQPHSNNVQIQENSELKSIPEIIHLDDDTAALEGLSLNNLEASKLNKVSDVVGIFTEESYDDKDKKVQFSDLDSGIRGRNQQLNKSGSQALVQQIDTVPSLTSAHIKPKIVLSPPNKNLLSDLDESWPKDLVNPVPKATANISRSVTSLGNIVENEEKLSAIIIENGLQKDLKSILDNNLSKPDYEERNADKKYGELAKDKITNQNLDDTVVSPTNRSQEQKGEYKGNVLGTLNESTNELFIKPYETEAGRTIGIVDKDRNQKHDVPIESSANDNNANAPQKARLLSINASHPIEKTTKCEESGTSATNIIYQAVQQKMNSSYTLPGHKFDYKVNPNTLPSWLRHDRGRGEPSEDSIDGQYTSKKKLKENEIRIWCKDLERMFANLDLWNSWLETTCKNILFLKQKRDYSELSKSLITHTRRKYAREWLTLKKNIDKDSILWTKMNQRANDKLQNYKARCSLEEKSQAQPHPRFIFNNKMIMEAMEDIDRISFWIHRSGSVLSSLLYAYT